MKGINFAMKSGGICEFCNKEFPTNSRLKRHIRTVHEGHKVIITKKNYKCHLCDFSARCQPYLDDHLISHSEERPHICSKCGQAFKRLYTLIKHEKRFHNNKSLKCDVCSNVFTSEYLLDLHKNKHSENYRKRKMPKKFRKENENNHTPQVSHAEIGRKDMHEEVASFCEISNSDDLDDKESDKELLIPDEIESEDDSDKDKEEETKIFNNQSKEFPKFLIHRLDKVKDAVKVAKLNPSPQKNIIKLKNAKQFIKSEVELAVQNLLFSDSIQVQNTCEIHSTEPSEIDVINP